jgi:hypothetical protein
LTAGPVARDLLPPPLNQIAGAKIRERPETTAGRTSFFYLQEPVGPVTRAAAEKIGLGASAAED